MRWLVLGSVVGLFAGVSSAVFLYGLRLVSLERVASPAAISGGFASVFGVPMAGTIFGLEVLSVGRIRHEAIVPALAAAVVGNVTFDLAHLPHDVTPHYTLPEVALTCDLLLKVAVASLVFGFAAGLFAELTEGLKRVFASAARLVGKPLRWSSRHLPSPAAKSHRVRPSPRAWSCSMPAARWRGRAGCAPRVAARHRDPLMAPRPPRPGRDGRDRVRVDPRLR